MPDEEKPDSKISTWTLIVLAIGAPPAAAYSFPEWAFENRLLAVGLVLLWWIVLIVVGFFKKVGQNLQDPWAKGVAGSIDSAVRQWLSGYRKYYLDHAIYYRHRNFDVKGLTTQGTYTLELDQVFVELSLAPMPAHEASANPIENLPESLRTGKHSVWDYLQLGTNSEPQNLAVLGAPGSGKTTLLKHMALTLALGKKAKSQAEAPRFLPVLLFLRQHATAIAENANLSLVQAVDASLANLEQKAPPGWFAQELSAGNCLIMLDGVDEVADPELRRRVVRWVEQQMTAHGKNHFVVTSRPFGYRDNPLSGVTVLDVRPFNSEQVDWFVHNWYVANEIKSQQRDDPGVREDAQSGAKDLLSRLWGTPALSELAVNPLLLTMIATVHRYRSSLPGRRVELYAEICEVFLGKRQQARGMELDLTPAQKQAVLEPLAHHMMWKQIREIEATVASTAIHPTLARVNPKISAEGFFKSVEDSSGLLIERENGVYSFSHLTFQEYLAAAHIQRHRLGADLKDHVTESWWHETIRLYAAQADASPIVEACLGGERRSVPALVLAIECMEEAREIEPRLRERFDRVLEEELEDPDPAKARPIAEALLEHRLRRFVWIDDDRAIDDSLISNAEYQLFLDEMQAKGEHHQPDHWCDLHYPRGQARQPVVGVRVSDAEVFCSWLRSRTQDPWRFRLPLATESRALPLDRAGHWGHWARADGGGWEIIQDSTRSAQRPVAIDGIVAEEASVARTLAFAHDLAHDLDRVLDRALNRALALDLARARNLAHAHALALARALDLDLVRARDLNLALDLDLDLVHTSALARALDLDLVHTSALDRDLDRTLARAFALALACARDLDLRAALNRALMVIDSRATVRAGELGGDARKATSFLCDYIVLLIFLALTFSFWFGEINKWPSEERRKLKMRSWTIDSKAVEDLEAYCRRLLVNFGELRRRIDGESEAWEGIRIVRERKVEGDRAEAA